MAIVLCLFLGSVGIGYGEIQDYLRDFEDFIPSLTLEEKPLPAVSSGSSADSPVDFERIQSSVFELVVFSKSDHLPIQISNPSTAFSVQSGNSVLLATAHHVLRSTGPVSVLVKNRSGKWFHATKIVGASKSHDLVLMEASVELTDPLKTADQIQKTLDRVVSVGLLGRLGCITRSGEVIKVEDGSFLCSLPASRGSSGSPVFNEKGLLLGMISEIVPLLRATELHKGDHFSEFTVTRCRSWHSLNVKE